MARTDSGSWWKQPATTQPKGSGPLAGVSGTAGAKKRTSLPTWQTLGTGLGSQPKPAQPAAGSLNALLGNNAQTNPFAGNLTAVVPEPTWWQKLQQRLGRLNELGTPTSLGGATNTPNFNTQYNQPMTLSQPAYGNVSLNQLLGLGQQVNPFISPGIGPSLNQVLGLPQGTNPFVTPERGTVGARAPLATDFGSGGFSPDYGGNWRRRRGGGYGGGYGYGDNGARDYMPAWYLNLNSWNYGE